MSDAIAMVNGHIGRSYPFVSFIGLFCVITFPAQIQTEEIEEIKLRG